MISAFVYVDLDVKIMQTYGTCASVRIQMSGYNKPATVFSDSTAKRAWATKNGTT